MNTPVGDQVYRSRDLSYEECREILARGEVGRVALCGPSGPAILPVNYVLHRDAIVFRTGPYGSLGRLAANQQIAFEVDELDPQARSGQSVVATGRGEMLEDRDDLAEIRALADPTAWARGIKLMYVRLAWTSLSGRRVGKG
jgi:nitroimidazol reductase NimA-like FMN-containing flavoprotein (pyridoxamine 5'-phosphate oxidase superfamily)